MDRSVIRSIDWPRVFPGLVLFRALGPSLTFSLLALAGLANVLTPLGWRVAELAFLPAASSRPEPSGLRTRLRQYQAWPGESGSHWQARELAEPGGLAPVDHLVSAGGLVRGAARLSFGYRKLIDPLVALLERPRPPAEMACLGAGILWSLLVWSAVAGVITRTAMIRLARGQRLPRRDAWRHVRGRWRSYLAAPLFPLCGAVLLSLPTLLGGLVVRATGWVELAAVLWLPALLFGYGASLMLLGVACGWPLMWCTISCEATGDVFEATSRSYAYVFQRPLQLVAYALVAVAVALPVGLLVSALGEWVIQLTHATLAWGAGWELAGELRPSRLGPVAWPGLVSGLADRGVRIVATAFWDTYFWSASAAIYLLLRHHADHTELDEVYLDEPPAEDLGELAESMEQEAPTG